MVVRLRLQRYGTKKNPLFRMVAADHRAPVKGRYLEQLGTFNPKPNLMDFKLVHINFERVKYWLSVGAQPSERVYKLLSLAGMLPSFKKGVPEGWDREIAQQVYDTRRLQHFKLIPKEEHFAKIKEQTAKKDTTIKEWYLRRRTPRINPKTGMLFQPRDF